MDSNSFFSHKTKAGIVFINLIAAFALITFSVLFKSDLGFKIAVSIGDLRYIEHALELKHQFYFEPLTNSINPPAYPFTLFAFSFFFKFSSTNIIVFQWLLLTFALTILSIELFLKFQSYYLLFSIYLFTYFNPIFNQVNDGGVFPEFFTSIILFFVIAIWLRYLRLKGMCSLILLSTVSTFLMLTRYEFIILIGFIFIDMVKMKLYKHSSIYLVIPIIFISLNGIKNYIIFNEFKLLSYSTNETKFWSVTSDGSWHSIDSSNANQFIPSKYLNQFVLINSDSNIVKVIKQKDQLYQKMYIDEWVNNFPRIIKMIPCKFMKLFVPPPSIDIYTCCPEPKCLLKIKSYFTNGDGFEGQNKFNIVIAFVFHFILFLLTIISVYFNWSSLIMDPFFRFVIVNSLLLIFIFYGLSRFCFNFYPIFILIQSLCFVKHKRVIIN